MIKKFLSGLFSLSILAAAIVAVLNTQQIVDWWTLRDYTPSLAVSNLASNTGMSDYGRKLFYVHDPSLLTKQNFAGTCDQGEASIILGCYISRQKIYLLDVEDERLEGVEEVTAAHEMLHAAFDRLSTGEREEISKLLVSAFNNIDDERIRKTVAVYESKGEAVVANELHSILATEVAVLPSLLEQHYANYFLDRQLVVEFAQDYAEEFTKREKQIEAYDNQLSDLKGEIAREEAEVVARASFVEAERNRIDALRSNPTVFNSQVDGFNALIANYNVKVRGLNSLYGQHDEIVKLRNAIAHEERELIEAIDASIDTL